MLANRSMPVDALIPVLAYPDVPEAVERLGEAFGFTLRWRIGDHRAQLAVGDTAAVAIVRGERPNGADHVMVRVADVRALRERALAAGAAASTVEEFPYGERQCTCVDFSGRTWVFSESVADVDPREWGAATG
ncbi:MULTISPECIES: glyoxalase [unclassified Microbacterium]|uniref:glyoxalase n=1 Tax=unclassified Microbacterium TaxID=2609290 RepID=UPI0012FCAFC3|nr:glyoxalase [Microbacterium sp. MAH-37]MVQ42179.1 glyoxalase [Microbacterium sp. MAH-37]